MSKEKGERKREVDALRKEKQENLEKIKQLEEKNISNETNLWRTILQILQNAANMMCQPHPVLAIQSKADGFLVNLENHGKIFVQGEVPKPYQVVALEIVNGVVYVIRGAINCIAGFFQYFMEWVRGKPAIKNE